MIFLLFFAQKNKKDICVGKTRNVSNEMKKKKGPEDMFFFKVELNVDANTRKNVIHLAKAFLR